jgi:branched-chain amino acid transport system permease protein
VTAIFAQVVVNWIMLSLIYSLLALGLTLIYSVMRILNFTHGALYMLGGYVAYYSIVRVGLPYPLGLAFAFILIGLLGVLLYKGLLRHFRTNIFVCLIMTAGLSSIFDNLAYIIFSPYEKSVPSITSKVLQGPFGVSLSAERLIIMCVALVLTFGLLFLINYSKPGRAMRAIAQDAEAAMLQGVSAENIFTLGMFLASGLAGISGALMASVLSVGPFVGTDMVMNCFNVILVGGVGSIAGALVGSFLVGLITSICLTFLSGDVGTMIIFALLILIILIRPRGLVGGV